LVDVAPITVLIADGRARVRYALGVLLRRQAGIVVVGEADQAESLIEQAESLCPDLVLVDWGLPGLTNGRSIQTLRRRCPEISLIVLSGSPEAQQAALDAGADDFVNKTESAEHLLSTIEQCCGGSTPQATEASK
jgi:DNA-binding NarL/FixJ family response regulator